MQAQIHAPRTGYAYNLLDNSDFRNPINQRGASTYSGDFTYSIDRWQLGNGGAQIYVISDGLKISNATGAGDYIFQRLERLPPGNYTFAAKFRDNTGAAALTNYSTDQGVTLAPTSYADSGVLVLTFSNGEDLDSTFAYYRLQNTTPGAVCTWEWAALYEGSYTADTLPPYQPKGYAAELAECKRYYELLDSGTSQFVRAYKDDVIAFCVDYYEKRAVPVISMTGALGNALNVAGVGAATPTSIESAAPIGRKSARVNAMGSFDTSKTYAISYGIARLSISADL